MKHIKTKNAAFYAQIFLFQILKIKNIKIEFLWFQLTIINLKQKKFFNSTIGSSESVSKITLFCFFFSFSFQYFSLYRSFDVKLGRFCWFKVLVCQLLLLVL